MDEGSMWDVLKIIVITMKEVVMCQSLICLLGDILTDEEGMFQRSTKVSVHFSIDTPFRHLALQL